MIVDFKNIPLDSRIWVYQSCIDFNENQLNIINEKCSVFLKDWKAHGNDLESSFLVKNNRFIIIAVNESYNSIGGCSIDYSLQLIKEISDTINLDLLDRLKVNYRLGEEIHSIKLSDLKNKIKSGSFSAETIIFNTTVKTKEELNDNFEISISSSWLSKFI